MDSGQQTGDQTGWQTPWEYLQRATQPWIFGLANTWLQAVIRSYYESLQQLPAGQTILLAESDPIKFLAFWVAGASSTHRLILANPNWQSHEWQQVYNATTPDIIIGTAPSQASISPSPKPIDALPTSTILIPTGGSSGQIKFAVHTWSTLTATVSGLQTFFGWQQINSCCTLPLYHVSGLMQAVRALVSGGTIVLHAWQDLKTSILPDIPTQDYCLSLVPTQLSHLLTMAEQQTKIIDWLRPMPAIFLGGAPAWPSLLQQARALQLPLAPTYGMTETAAQIATLKPQEFLQGQTGCGRILPHAQVVIATQFDSTGPISIKAKSLLHSYWPPQRSGDNQNILPTTKNSDRVFVPDDIGYFDHNHFLHILGRNSDKIISGGENIFPAEIEAAIRATQLVQDVCVLGLPDDRWGEIVAAVIVPGQPHQQDKTLINLIQTALTDQLSKYKHPKQWLVTNSLPRQPSGKLAKPVMKSWLIHAASEQ